MFLFLVFVFSIAFLTSFLIFSSSFALIFTTLRYNQSFCKDCRKAAHEDIESCVQAAASLQADEEIDEMLSLVISQGGRWCPKCGEVSAAESADPTLWMCDHMTCGQCSHQFCRNCGADRTLILEHDNSWHVPS